MQDNTYGVVRRAACHIVILIIAVSGGGVATAYAEDRTFECGELKNPTGPWDYRDRSPQNQANLGDQKMNHLDPAARSISAGDFSRMAIGDLDFLLRSFPNHHEALNLLVKFELGGGERGRFRTTDCYFDRAKRFAPDDVTVLLLEAIYLSKKGDRDRARANYEKALAMYPESLDVNYNAGLFFFESGDYERATHCAKVAYANGYPLEGLRQRLQSAGVDVGMTD